MRLALVMLFFVRAAVVMAVRQLCVVVVVCVPISPVVPLAQHFPTMVMRNVIVIVRMGHRGMDMLRLFPFPLRVLCFIRQRHPSLPSALPRTNARKFTHTVIAAESTAYTAAVAELYQDDCEKKLTGTGKRLIDLLGNPSEHCFV